MKTPALVLLLLLIFSKTAHSQETLLITTILLEGKNIPARGVEVKVLDKKKVLQATLTTDIDGKITYLTDKPVLYLDIRSKDLGFKSCFERVIITPQDTVKTYLALNRRDPEETAQLEKGMEKSISAKGQKDAKLRSETCPNFIAGTKDTATLKEVYSCLMSSLQYPVQAQDWDVEGKVKVKFIITETGEITNVELIDGSYAILEEEALRAAACLSGLSPATCDGKKVPTYYVLPVTFRLE